MITKDEIVFWIKRFRKLNTNNLSHRRRLIDSFINSIYLYDDKMVITFNYSEGTETITFDEINAINKMSARSDLTSSAAPKITGIPQGMSVIFILRKEIRTGQLRSKSNSPVDCYGARVRVGERFILSRANSSSAPKITGIPQGMSQRVEKVQIQISTRWQTFEKWN